MAVITMTDGASPESTTIEAVAITMTIRVVAVTVEAPGQMVA